MRVTQKGQVTIPREIREKAGIFPETEVDFVFDGERIYLQKNANFSHGIQPATGPTSPG